MPTAPGLAPGHPQVRPGGVLQLYVHHISYGLRPLVWGVLSPFLPLAIPRSDREIVSLGVPVFLLRENSLLPHGEPLCLCFVSPIHRDIEHVLPWDKLPARSVSEACLSAHSLAGRFDDSR